MNKIIVKGRIKDIRDDHIVNNIQYQKADIIVPRAEKGKEDIITLKFKKYMNPYKNGDSITLEGNLRSYSQRLDDRNKVELYMFTLFKETDFLFEDSMNNVTIDGHICKMGELKRTKSEKDVLNFTLANNISVNESKILNCYIPVVAWGKWAKQLSEYKIGDYINLDGRLQSREYLKVYSDDSAELRIAHEVSISKINSLFIDLETFDIEL